MPFSILLQGYPIHDIPTDEAQGSAIQGMFLHLLEMVDPAVSARVHDEKTYRPYTLSPLGLGSYPKTLKGFRRPHRRILEARTRCYLRVGLLDDDLFPPFSRYFLDQSESSFILGHTKFTVTGIFQETSPDGLTWSQYVSYAELVNRASPTNRKITLRFLTPTSFRRGRIDFPLPHPQLVFGSYLRRFREFHDFEFLPDFTEQVDFHTGISNLDRLHTELIRRKRVNLIGFTGRVTYTLDSKAPSELVHQMNLLSDYAFFCGTGQKTTIGLGQTIRQEPSEMPPGI